MPRGPKGEKRPADAIGNAVMIAKIATGEIEGVWGGVIAYLWRAKGRGRYHHQFGPFRAMSHGPSLSACRFRKLATPTTLV
jgi:hypothetical protein